MTDRQKQHLLAYLGYYVGNIDGIFGSGSREATKSFQRSYGLNPDGIFGNDTADKIKEVIYKELPPQTEPPDVTSDMDELFTGIRYWSPDEFRCQCGGKYCDGFPNLPDRTLLELLDDIREHFGIPAIRSSGLRCPTWNAIQGGVANSKHMSGKAMDFSIPGVSGEAVRAYAAADPRCSYTYVIDGNWVHVDVA